MALREYTLRKQQVVSGIARRLPYKTIGRDIGVSTSTVCQVAWRMQHEYGVRAKDLPGEIEFLSWLPALDDPAPSRARVGAEFAPLVQRFERVN